MFMSTFKSSLQLLEAVRDQLPFSNQLKSLSQGMPQNALTVRAHIDADSEAQLRALLKSIADNVANNETLSFEQFKESLHFARLLILEGPDHPNAVDSSLFFLANVDGSVDQFIRDLVVKAGSGIDAIFEHCKGYPAPDQRHYATRVTFLKNHLIPAQAFYVNTIGRSAEQIHQEEALRVALQAFLKTLNPESFASAKDLRKTLVQFVKDQPKLAWALVPVAKPSGLWRLKEWLRLGILAWAGAIIVFWLWPLLLGWLVVLQQKERQDVADSHRPALGHLTQLRATEDVYVHNQFSATGSLKPGFMRKWTVKVALSAAQVTLRHIFNNGNLAGVPLLGLEGVDTIHFARWILIDDDTRMLFASNYDGSLESYMVDFIDKVAWGLNLVFSNGQGYPFTRWLVHEGAEDEEKFKDYIGNHQIPTQVWYAAYGHLSAVNIANNARIRAGLNGELSETDAQHWLSLI